MPELGRKAFLPDLGGISEDHSPGTSYSIKLFSCRQDVSGAGKGSTRNLGLMWGEKETARVTNPFIQSFGAFLKPQKHMLKVNKGICEQGVRTKMKELLPGRCLSCRGKDNKSFHREWEQSQKWNEKREVSLWRACRKTSFLSPSNGARVKVRTSGPLRQPHKRQLALAIFSMSISLLLELRTYKSDLQMLRNWMGVNTADGGKTPQ